MSHYVTPILVLNLGSEMLYVISQRLQAQHVDLDRAIHVLDEITSTLISQELIADIMKPQHPYRHEQVRKIIEEVAESSVMRLDPISMSRLWDLVTMVFKWQVTLSTDVIRITQRHLYEIETFVAVPETQLQLHKVQNLVDNFTKLLSVNEQIVLHRGIVDWLDVFNVRVSLLLRLGLQRQDASFITDRFGPECEDMVKNLGENVYSVTQRRNHEECVAVQRRRADDDATDERNDRKEVQMFVDQILGVGPNVDCVVPLKLSIDEDCGRVENATTKAFVYSEISVTRDSALHDVLSDINNHEDDEEEARGDDNASSLISDDFLDIVIDSDD